MKPVSISDAKNNLSALIRKVRRGASITITDRGVPVARIVPPSTSVGVPPWAIELAQQGVVTLPEVEPSTKWDIGLPPAPTLSSDTSVVALLLDERSSGW